MSNLSRVVKRVARFQNRLPVVQMPQYPILLKPGDVANLPEQRINDLQTRPHHLFIVQIVDERNRTAARFAQRFGDRGREIHSSDWCGAQFSTPVSHRDDPKNCNLGFDSRKTMERSVLVAA